MLAENAAKALSEPKVIMDTLWVVLGGMLVFFMNLGFACVETGLCRAKNAVNILSKNFVVFAASTLGFWVVGWGLMFGDGNAFMGTSGLWFVGGEDFSPLTGDAIKIGEQVAGDYDSINWSTTPLWIKFFFQLVFCGTAATIVSGAVAERIKYGSFIVFTIFMAIAVYPIVGHWIWGGGFLGAGGFLDFAGSTQVHSIGGWAALAGILVLGPRIGKYGPDGRVNPIPGHSMALATIGCFILWLGWFGFNPGSTMAADAGAIGLIMNTTNIAAVMATLTATATCWIMMGKPDLGMTLNGSLAGLVAITAPCAWVSVGHAAIIGAIAGVLVVVSVIFWDKMKIDDPVGALSVHLVNGVFGTICVGLFHDKNGLFTTGKMDQLVAQFKGIGATAIYVFGLTLVGWLLLKKTIGIRVSREEELQGLDLGEHGQEAYSGFQMIQGK
ncbi:MAG TPA: ammonium transporter [Planctomycetota bacterium]|nr:ammonium transporter [Planctomycetota bacterium]